MHIHNLDALTHDHRFHESSQAAERGTQAVMWITLVTMAVEVVAGWWFNSMALLADGWHMSSHAVAIGVSAFAYRAARRHALDKRFAFGTWKIEILGGFASAIVLIGVAGLMVVGSVERLFAPQDIHYQQAIGVAVIGLIVNVVCAFILMRAGGDHGHSHGHAHGHSHGHSHVHHEAAPADKAHAGGDLNLKSAYVHVLADAATSVLAIAALIGGLFFGWSWLDPVMGLVGAVLVAVWAWGLIGQTSRVLLDREMDAPVVEEIREAVEVTDEARYTKLTDLHVWRVGQAAYACALTLVTHDASLTPDTVRAQLAIHEEIVHSTIEIHRCA
jgi:cation diffusion facilitator family transporter